QRGQDLVIWPKWVSAVNAPQLDVLQSGAGDADPAKRQVHVFAPGGQVPPLLQYQIDLLLRDLHSDQYQIHHHVVPEQSGSSSTATTGVATTVKPPPLKPYDPPGNNKNFGASSTSGSTSKSASASMIYRPSINEGKWIVQTPTKVTPTPPATPPATPPPTPTTTTPPTTAVFDVPVQSTQSGSSGSEVLSDPGKVPPTSGSPPIVTSEAVVTVGDTSGSGVVTTSVRESESSPPTTTVPVTPPSVLGGVLLSTFKALEVRDPA